MNKKILATFVALGMVLMTFSVFAMAAPEHESIDSWGLPYGWAAWVYQPDGTTQLTTETAATFAVYISVDEDTDGLYWPDDAADTVYVYSDGGMNAFAPIDDANIGFAYIADTMAAGQPGGAGVNYKIYVDGSGFNFASQDGWCGVQGAVAQGDGTYLPADQIFTFVGGGGETVNFQVPGSGPVAAEASATGPTGTSGYNTPDITYTIDAGAPASVDVWSWNGASWTNQGTDSPATSPFTMPVLADGTYSWYVQTPDEAAPTVAGDAEAGPYIIDSAAKSWGLPYGWAAWVYQPDGVTQLTTETAATFSVYISVDTDYDHLYWPDDATDTVYVYSDGGMNGFASVDDANIGFAYLADTMAAGQPGGAGVNYKIYVDGSGFNFASQDGWCGVQGAVAQGDGTYLPADQIFTFVGGGGETIDFQIPAAVPVQGATVSATTPATSGTDATPDISYDHQLDPALVDIYYWQGGAAGGPWTLWGNDIAPAVASPTTEVWTPGSALPADDDYYFCACLDGGSVGDPLPTVFADAELGPYALDATAPTMQSSVPINTATSVATNADIVITFDEPMQNPVTYTCTPDPGGWSRVWSVGNTVMTMSHITDFAEQTSYTFTITGGLDTAGNALSGTPIDIQFTTADETGPAISFTTLIDGAVDVATGTNFVAGWNETMNEGVGTVNIVPAPLVAGSWVWSGASQIYTYSGMTWDEETTYTLTFSNFADTSANAATGDLVKTFTTADETAPTIISVTPADGAVNVSVASGVMIIELSEPVTVSVTPTDNLPNSNGGLDATGMWANITYDALADQTTYYLDMTGSGIADMAGNPLGGDMNITFTTGDFTDPSIATTTPNDGVSDVATGTSFVANWDEAMNEGVGTVNIVPAPLVAGSWAWSGSSQVYTYSGMTWDEETTYTLTFSNFADTSANAATGDLTKAFTTADETDPTVISTNPVDDAIDVATTAGTYSIEFSEPMDSSINGFATDLPTSGFGWSANDMWFNITYNVLAEDTDYYVSIWSQGHQDIAGNALAGSTVFNLTTGDFTDPISGVDAISPYGYTVATPLTITATASDTGSGVASVELFYRYAADGATWGAWTSFGVDNAMPWSWNFNYPDNDGSYEFYSIATDNASLVETAPGVADTSAQLDTVEPTSSVDAIGTYWQTTSPLTITATANDDTSGMDTVELFYSFDGGAWTSFGTDNMSPWSWSFDFPAGEGDYEFYSIATDLFGLIEAAPAGADTSAGLDTTSPTIVSATLADGTTNIFGATNVSVTDGNITIEFSEPIDLGTITGGNSNVLIDGNNASWSAGNTIVVVNYTMLGDLTDYYWNMTGAFFDLAGNPLGETNITFSTGDETAPIADAGADQSIDNGDEVTFDESASTDNGVIVNYTWTFTDVDAQTLYGAAPTYTFDNAGVFVVTLNVTDAYGNYHTDTMLVNVTASAPMADAGTDQVVVEGTNVTFDGTGSVNAVNYTWTIVTDSIVSSGTDAVDPLGEDSNITLYGMAPYYNFTVAGNYTVYLTVMDGANNTSEDNMTVDVMLDTDGDGLADIVDTDDDGDGVNDTADAFPLDETETVDTDGDGTGDNADAFPDDATETTDTDGDGVGDVADEFPDDATETTDTDGDGVGDVADAFPDDATETTDTDGDGVGDVADAFPNDATETTDTDGDGVGDVADAFPNDATETTDTDGDGIGDNADDDTVDDDTDDGASSYLWIIILLVVVAVVGALIFMKKGKKPEAAPAQEDPVEETPVVEPEQTESLEDSIE